ncbi:NlpC/P60 family protein [Trinickia caryophylli]|uniref:Cell wall-associated hydrolase, NlpC family n=1 Tax=Trinickia caryophylli TaxID=28094 RepID=A0A1X7FWP9_TRICW|nr:C40 family peptidase [Trinickia caryophylli]PMS11755.1 hydrolase Nlp/P60 [Trinickia caryophylli]TRX17436.1 peptidoglycan endopeptidase [Trinickia caryophylli]WQE11821.1 NlpC/P60 family protein [Trinickia caryophylli]SMF60086.1 Cell wall-associated hydrolase, NlpC family [Trinickia caryophylli]
MRRFWFLILVALSLAACSSAPPQASRSNSRAGGEALRTVPRGLPNFVDHSIGREEISVQAMSLVGVPYRWAGNTPASGFDCSGLVQYVLARAADVKLPRTTAEMSLRGQAVEPDEIAPGDLIFFNTSGRPHSHVGIYVGKLRFINAPSTGGTVRLDYLTNPYWAKRFDGIRRVAPPLEQQPAPFDAPTYLAQQSHPAPGTPTRTETAGRRADTIANNATQAGTPIEPYQPPPAVSNQAGDHASLATVSSTGIGKTTAAPVDAIDAAADAFEPPPPAAVQASRQARQAGGRSIEPALPGVQIMRASTTPNPQPATTSTTDDPIARFAADGE